MNGIVQKYAAKSYAFTSQANVIEWAYAYIAGEFKIATIKRIVKRKLHTVFEHVYIAPNFKKSNSIVYSS